MKRTGVLSAFACVLAIAAPLSAQTTYNKRIPYKDCSLKFKDTCYQISGNSAYTVSNEIGSLTSLGRFCLKVDTLISGGGGPARVTLMVDVSSSMCYDQFEDTQNDPRDARILAARTFIDSLAANRPASEVGLVIFGSGVSYSLYPLPLSVPENVTRLKKYLFYASCKSKAPSYYPADGPLAAEKDPGLRKTAATKATGLGISLDSALTIIDDSLEFKPQFFTSRHVVILTDGGWDDFGTVSPAVVRSRYSLKSPGRPFPMIHGVYMTASGSLPTRPELSQITTETGGLFFGNVTPATISARLLEILDIIVTTPFAHVLQGLRITNLTSGVSANAISVSLSDPIENSYEVVLPAIPLPIGENVLLIARSVYNPKTAQVETLTDTVRITRSDKVLPPNQNLGSFVAVCARGLTGMSFEPMSSKSLVDSPATVIAAIRPESLSVIDKNDVSLWAITPYSASEPGILLLYHFDRNTDEASNRAGLSNAGGMSYATGAFADGIAGGSSFQLLPPAGSQSTNFSIEFWIKTDTAFVDRTLLSHAQFSLTTTGNGNVRFTSGAVTISGDIDKSSWHHVAIGRSSGSIMLFIDGVFAEEQPLSTAFTGAVTVSCPSGFLMDELCVRSALQTATSISGKPSLILPQSEKVTWSIPGQAPATPSAPLPSASWQGPPVGTLTFTVRSSEAVDLMISMRHLSTDPDLMWAKMAGPIRISGDLKPPVANPPGQGFTGSLSVTLTSADRATIRYTTDGSDPTESSPVYAGPLTLTHSQTIKARAFGTGYTPSSIMSESYIRQSLVVNAWYSDSDGDGKIDRAAMIFDTLESGLPESFTFTDPFNAANTIKVTAAQTVPGTIPFSYTASLPAPFTLGTGFSPGLFGIVDKGDGFSRNPFMVADSVAPVVVAAAYRPGAITSGSRTSDTLVVDFSESVVMIKNGSIIPFKLKSGDLEYTFLVRVADQSGSEVVFAVDSVIGEVRYPKNGDKISLHIGEVKDVAGSIQQSSNNREVPLSVTYPPVITEQKTAPNPFTPGVSALPTRITAILRNDPLLPEPLRNTKFGTVVILKSMTVLPAEILNLSAHATIYDQVGNAVRKDMQLSKDAENSLYLVWDGRNENGRYVGSGTYIAAIKTFSIAGAKVHQSKIGVRR